MPFYDYRCPLCNRVDEDQYYASWRQAPRAYICPQCVRETMVQDWSQARNFIHPSHSALYGRPEPALGGEIIRDYAHKRRLLRDLNVEESNDPVKGSRCFRKEKPPPAGPPSVWTDDMETTDSL